MKEINRVILIKGEDTNWGYASEQIAMELEKYGVDTYFVDYNNLLVTIRDLGRFAEPEHTALLTFNFRGLSREMHFMDEKSNYIWNRYAVRYINLLMDHPMFFDEQLKDAPENMLLFCADKDHVRYMKKYYPNITAHFLPVAGNVNANISLPFLKGHRMEETSYGIKYRDYDQIWNYEKQLKPIADRPMDVLFTANYVPIQNLFDRIQLLDSDYRHFLREIIDDLDANPRQAVDHIMIRHLEKINGEMSQEQVRTMLGEMSILNLCVRTLLRERIVRVLVNGDIKVHVCGADWDLFTCKKPWNLVLENGYVPVNDCVDAVKNAKISLNIMPLFSNGAHERVFTAMLQKTVALTDHSGFLDDKMRNERDVAFYQLTNLKELPDIVGKLLENPDNMQRIADNGYKRAYKEHTWRERAGEIYRYL